MRRRATSGGKCRRMPFASALLPDHLPSLRLSLVPTPLQLEPAILPSLLPDTRLPDLWCKRDDLTGLVTTETRFINWNFSSAQTKRKAVTLITWRRAEQPTVRPPLLWPRKWDTIAAFAAPMIRSRPDGNLLLDRCSAQTFVT